MMQVETGKVIQILEERDCIQELVVQIGEHKEKAIHYIDLTTPVNPGDTVTLNTTAVRLGLGTGGYHFVMAKENLQTTNRNCDINRNGGHIMKLRYTPGQVRVFCCEEADHPSHELLRDQDSLAGMPVIAAELHSQLPALVASIHFATFQKRPLRIAYVMTDGAALPIHFSNTVSRLKKNKMLAGTVTVGHAFGGDIEAVNLYSGLLAAKYVLQSDIAIVTMGPGIVGTGTRFGHTGIEQGQVINATASLNGRAIVCPRISFADHRPRHQGISHHTLTALGKVALAKAIVCLPRLQPEKEERIRRQMDEYSISSKHLICYEDGFIINRAANFFDLRLSTMGRSLVEDQAFFLAAGATGETVVKLFFRECG